MCELFLGSKVSIISGACFLDIWIAVNGEQDGKLGWGEGWGECFKMRCFRVSRSFAVFLTEVFIQRIPISVKEGA